MDSRSKNNLFYELFYRTRKNMFIILYASCVICIGSLITILANNAKVPLRIEFLIGFLIAIVGIVVGLFFSLLLDLPEVGWKFDEIKNDIALGKIRTSEEFAKRVSKFMLNNFNFILINVEYTFIHIIHSTRYYSDHAIPDVIREKEMDSIILQSQQTQDVIYIGRYLINTSNYHLYIIPVWFGETWLGCIGLFNNRKLMKVLTLFLSSFENECIDDQLFHVLDFRSHG